MTTDQRRARRPSEAPGPPLERRPGLVRVRSLVAARQVLRERAKTRQAGFTAEKIPQGAFRHRPILISDGPLHDEQRSKVARFFAPAVVDERYGEVMTRSADRLLAQAQRAGSVALDEVALHFTVEVTAVAVGLTESPVPAMSKRLVSFFNQPPLDITRPDLGRTRRDWARAAVNGLVPLVRFYVRDVRPSIRARRTNPGNDIISHLLAEGYSTADILVECVTYGTAGMVTTREFICMAAWHLLTDADLGARFRAAKRPERLAILGELLRLEPVVGHLYRRATDDFTISDGDRQIRVEAGDLVDLSIRDANADPAVVTPDPLGVCPGRALPPGVDATGLTFGDGAHACPGRPLALREADVLLTRLLALNPELVSEPELSWDDLIEGYALRGLTLRLPGP